MRATKEALALAHFDGRNSIRLFSGRRNKKLQFPLQIWDYGCRRERRNSACIILERGKCQTASYVCIAYVDLTSSSLYPLGNPVSDNTHHDEAGKEVKGIP